MKKIITLVILLISITGKAQWLPTMAIGDSTNFEVHSNLAQIDTSAGNIWQIGLPQKPFFDTAHSAPFAIMTDTINPYPVNNLSSFIVGLDSSIYMGVSTIEVSFWHKYETDTLMDGGFVEVTIDSGATWINLANAAPYYMSFGLVTAMQNIYQPTDTILGNIPCFNGTHSDWEFSSFALYMIVKSPTISNSFNKSFSPKRFMFRFSFKSDSIQTNKAGWIIDNIAIGIPDVGGGITQNTLTSFNVEVFPNPINEQGIIQAVSPTNQHNYTITLYNSIGQILKTSPLDKNNQYIINANELSSGIYFYSVKNRNGESKNGKLVIK